MEKLILSTRRTDRTDSFPSFSSSISIGYWTWQLLDSTQCSHSADECNGLPVDLQWCQYVPEHMRGSRLCVLPYFSSNVQYVLLAFLQ